jgi:CRISPR/Cas system CMR-associated protein Cmr5 small subunit
MEHAWRCASDTKEEIEGEYDEFINAVKNLPAQITTNGLGQALAYLAAEGLGENGKPTDPEGYLYQHVESWLTGREELGDAEVSDGAYAEQPAEERSTASTKLIYRIAQGSSTRYRRGTSEALDYLAVLRFASEAVALGPYDGAEGVNDESGTNSSGDRP